MKVAVKNKTEWKYIDAEKLEINGRTFQELSEEFTALKKAYERLANLLQNKLVLDPDHEYVVELTKGLEKVESLKVHEVPDTTVPIQYYKVEDGKLVVDPKKVGAAW